MPVVGRHVAEERHLGQQVDEGGGRAVGRLHQRGERTVVAVEHEVAEVVEGDGEQAHQLVDGPVVVGLVEDQVGLLGVEVGQPLGPHHAVGRQPAGEPVGHVGRPGPTEVLAHHRVPPRAEVDGVEGDHPAGDDLGVRSAGLGSGPAERQRIERPLVEQLTGVGREPLGHEAHDLGPAGDLGGGRAHRLERARVVGGLGRAVGRCLRAHGPHCTAVPPADPSDLPAVPDPTASLAVGGALAGARPRPRHPRRARRHSSPGPRPATSTTSSPPSPVGSAWARPVCGPRWGRARPA